MALWTFCLGQFKCLSCFVNGKKLFPLVNLSVTCHSTLNICLIFGVMVNLFAFQEHWWSWNQHAVTMPATLTALSQYSCVHSRKWCENISVPNRPTQESQKPAQVLAWMWKKHQTQRHHQKRSIGLTHLVVKSNKCHFYSVGVWQHAFTLLG